MSRAAVVLILGVLLCAALWCSADQVGSARTDVEPDEEVVVDEAR